MENKKLELDKSWRNHYENFHLGDYYLNGIKHFQKEAVKQLKRLHKQNLSTKEAINLAIETIKNLKSR